MHSTAPLILALLQGAPASGAAASGPAVAAPAVAPVAGAQEPAATADPFAAPAAAAPAAAAPAAAAPAGAQPGVVYYPYSDPGRDVTAGERGASSAHRKVVIAGLFGINFGVLATVPSIEASLFFGTDAPPRRSRAGRLWRTAFGYQATVSLGEADRAALVLSEIPRALEDQVFFHRHHLTAMGYGGPRERLYYSFGAGLWMHMTSFRGVEFEGRIGARFGVRPGNRGSGIVGVQARITAAFSGIPVPQIGPFVGFMAF